MNVSSSYCASVVVPTYKRPELLHRCVTALVAQDIVPTAFEIIIVDAAACAETRQAIETWAACLEESGHTLRYIPITGTHGPAAARNVGWRVPLEKSSPLPMTIVYPLLAGYEPGLVLLLLMS